ncbi:glycerophosphodiester phosphodiesterase family protein [Aridibaculum aurantiacum]|uniref:glycerophosphodiester phosphodiesterase family protein n=1 Tax=Aridibaculum aurantiacum TaxID=2810307 RepID=UPI001A969A61|nr:glycerophosphodiester phosphodiesterase family protein [Aridibaculum aurantiacum]
MEAKNALSTPARHPSFDLQGHRGCRGIMPENTWAAMKTALDMGVTTLEMDVVITKDKQVVLSHEPWFSHQVTTKPGGGYILPAEEKDFNIYNFTYEQVKQFDVGLKPHPRFPQQQKIAAVKPLLSEIFQEVQQYMLVAKRPYPFFNIEIKSLPEHDGVFHPEPAAFVELVMQVIKDNQQEKMVNLQSFDMRPLQFINKHYPAISTALLVEDDDTKPVEQQLKELGFTPKIYSPHFSLVTIELVKKCHDLNMKIIPWTVNDKSTFIQLKEMKVDGIITDYPALGLE